MTKMIPPIPTAAVMLPTPKQKIGFSIESIVGNDAAVSPTANHNTHNSSINATGDHHNSHESPNSLKSSNGPTSPPQTPPANTILGGTTHLPALPLPPHPHALAQHHHQQQQQQQSPHHPQHPHLPPHLTAAQQHALHQHLLMQPKFQNADGLPMRADIHDLLQRLHNSAAAAHSLTHLKNGPYSPPPQTRLSADDPDTALHLKRQRSPLPAAIENAQNPAQRHQPPHTPPKSVSPQSSHPPSSPPPPNMPTCGSPSAPGSAQQQFVKLPHPGPPGPSLMMPGMPPAGLVRPFPVGPGGAPAAPQQGLPDIKALPPYINAPPELQPQHNPHLIAAAQFQMAAALQAGHVLGPAAAAAAAAGLPPHAAQFMPGHPGMPRDSYPLYPWLLSRHGRIFPHRFPGNFLLQPFRKPKRIRTAFSPSQLLKLEHAFENNQYVVGAERKALAQSLNLSETQVKVWFQNRRTKHKRMQQEDEKGGNGGGGSSERNSQNASCDEDDDELIDMEMDDCPSDEEHELDASH